MGWLGPDMCILASDRPGLPTQLCRFRTHFKFVHPFLMGKVAMGWLEIGAGNTRCCVRW